MQRQLYPALVSEDSLEQHAARYVNRGSGIYLCILGLVVACAAALPFVHVDITVQSAGIIRPTTEKHDVRTSAGGAVDRIFVHEHQRVAAGDTIAALRATSVNERDSLLAEQLGTKQRDLTDLEVLEQAGTDSSVRPAQLQSPPLRQSYAQFVNESRDAAVQRAKATNDLARTRGLYDRGFAAAMDLEDQQFALDRARDNADAVVDRYRTQWQEALATLRTDIRSLESQRDLIREERSSYLVTAPVAGTVEELASISPSSYLQVGERIAVISPASPLVAEMYVSPRDIGMLRTGMPARILVDAFNYNDWGFVTGHVLDISSDFVQVENQPMFKVRCALDQDHLVLGNGVTGSLKKGMTLSARFFVARRSLLQLLRDNINDWLNPESQRA